jgi:hypothetical protein
MDAESLKALQAPLKAQYREAPDAAVIPAAAPAPSAPHTPTP